MKRLILIPFALLVAHILFAQPVKGKYFLGGTIGISKIDASTPISNGGFNKSMNVSIEPQMGYFINDRVAIGASLNYGSSYQENMNSINTGNIILHEFRKTFGGGLFARYYKPLNEKLFFTMHAGIGYAYSIVESETFYYDVYYGMYKNEIQNERKNSYNMSINPGFEYFVTPKLGISTNIGSISYNYYQTRNQKGRKQNVNLLDVYLFPFNLSDLSIGLKYYF
ncbi:MAG TPA: outer membrane beta-barrel protein [Bacteroidia bacterium]|nr:outer membrane beta-barrel protein [Bacteroidia bacterium]